MIESDWMYVWMNEVKRNEEKNRSREVRERAKYRKEDGKMGKRENERICEHGQWV